MQTLSVAQGTFTLARYPENKRDSLRAWDAADEYLLHHLSTESLPATGCRTLILNDAWGALSTALANAAPWALSDSFLSHKGTEVNLSRNGRASAAVRLLSSLDRLDDSIDLLLFKVPKNLALLEDELYRLRPLLHAQTHIVGAGMVRDVHTSTLDLCKRLIGPTHTSLAQKKARLIFSTLDTNLEVGPSPYPTAYALQGTEFTLENAANVFSRQRLDNGTRLLLRHIPSLSGTVQIADLGCGNGVIGLVAAERSPQAELIFVDESFMAVSSARANFQRAFRGRNASFIASDGLVECDPDSLDLVLCNPPFHRQQAIDQTVPWRMFAQAKRALKPGGQLLVVGNSGIRHHGRIKRIFGHCSTLEQTGKFVVLSAQKIAE